MLMAGTVNPQLPLPTPSAPDAHSILRTFTQWANSLVNALFTYGQRINLCLPKDGTEAMTGALTTKGITDTATVTLAADPTTDLQAATKHYVDTAIAGVFVMPSGSVVSYSGSSAPTGWLLCDGSAVSRTTYATLFGIIGSTFGSGDGSTTFNLPDMRGRVSVGKDNMGGTAANRVTTAGSSIDGTTLGATGGAQNQTLLSNNLPAGTMNVNGGTTTNSLAAGTGQFESGTAQPFVTMPPALILNYIIKT